MNENRIGAPPFAAVTGEGASAEHALVVGEIRGAISRCEAARIDKAVVSAVLLAELLPRLVDAYGTPAVAGVFSQLADYVAQIHPGAPGTRQ